MAYSGWHDSTARNVTDLWADELGAGEREAYVHDVGGPLDCTIRSGDRDVVECLFEGGHKCGQPLKDEVVFDFMEERSRLGLAPDPSATPNSSCGECDADLLVSRAAGTTLPNFLIVQADDLYPA